MLISGPPAEPPGSPAATFNLGSPQVEDDSIGPQGNSSRFFSKDNSPNPNPTKPSDGPVKFLRGSLFLLKRYMKLREI